MNKFDFNNRTAVITGGGQGFGLDIAKRFLNSGAKVIIWDIDDKMLKKAVENLNNRLLSLCDKHAPLKKLSNRQNKYLTKPWIDRELADEIKKKNRLYVKKCNVPSEINRRNFNND